MKWNAVVIITTKPTINDPPSITVKDCLRELGFTEVNRVVLSQTYEVRIEGDTEEKVRQRVIQICHAKLDKPIFRPIIQNFEIEIRPRQ